MRISKAFTFEASHILPRQKDLKTIDGKLVEVPGKCSRLHGHSWRLIVTVGGPVDKATGFVMDYAHLKRVVQPIVDRFDHQHLNAFVRYPSSENISIHIAHLLRPKFDNEIVSMPFSVEVSETANTSCIWDSVYSYCTDIFDKDLLDSKPGAMDAEWWSPEFNKTFVQWQTGDLQVNDEIMFDQWHALHTELVQRNLYVESEGKPGQAYEELKGLIKTHEE